MAASSHRMLASRNRRSFHRVVLLLVVHLEVTPPSVIHRRLFCRLPDMQRSIRSPSCTGAILAHRYPRRRTTVRQQLQPHHRRIILAINHHRTVTVNRRCSP
uniref:Putative secreted peptide n=1 Tax=Anopheles braziliensis TaxID=58242 RepID=A0A2M3ZNX8_9DIPT